MRLRAAAVVLALLAACLCCCDGGPSIVAARRCPRRSQTLRSVPVDGDADVRFDNLSGRGIGVHGVDAAGAESPEPAFTLAFSTYYTKRVAVGSAFRVRSLDRAEVLAEFLVGAPAPAVLTVYACSRAVVSAPVVLEAAWGRALAFSLRAGSLGPVGEPQDANIALEAHMTVADVCAAHTLDLEVAHTETCAGCGGHGGRRGAYKTVCGVCGGTGVIHAHHELCSGGGGGDDDGLLHRHPAACLDQSLSTACPHCAGAGHIVDDAHVCPSCGGNGTVRTLRRHVLVLPAGVSAGMAFVWDGMGHSLPPSDAALAPGQPSPDRPRPRTEGELRLTVFIADDDVYERVGDDLEVSLNVTLVEALTGFTRTLRHPDGTNATLERRGVTPHDEVIVLPGRGLPVLPTAAAAAPPSDGGGGRVGDMRVTVSVQFPETLRDYQRAVLDTLLRNMGGDAGGGEERGEAAAGGGRASDARGAL